MDILQGCFVYANAKKDADFMDATRLREGLSELLNLYPEACGTMTKLDDGSHQVYLNASQVCKAWSPSSWKFWINSRWFRRRRAVGFDRVWRSNHFKIYYDDLDEEVRTSSAPLSGKFWKTSTWFRLDADGQVGFDRARGTVESNYQRRKSQSGFKLFKIFHDKRVHTLDRFHCISPTVEIITFSFINFKVVLKECNSGEKFIKMQKGISQRITTGPWDGIWPHRPRVPFLICIVGFQIHWGFRRRNLHCPQRKPSSHSTWRRNFHFHYCSAVPPSHAARWQLRFRRRVHLQRKRFNARLEIVRLSKIMSSNTYKHMFRYGGWQMHYPKNIVSLREFGRIHLYMLFRKCQVV